MTGLSMSSKDDHETIAKTGPVYNAFYTNIRLEIIREKYKAETAKMNMKQLVEFLRRKLKE